MKRIGKAVLKQALALRQYGMLQMLKCSFTDMFQWVLAILMLAAGIAYAPVEIAVLIVPVVAHIALGAGWFRKLWTAPKHPP